MHYFRGAIAEGEADGRQALSVPGLPPFAVPFISAFVCLSLVERGELDDAEAILAASGCGPELPEVLHMNHVFWARGRLRTAQGRLPEALDDLLEFGRRSERVEFRNPVIAWRAEAALLHARLGDRDAAQRLAGEYGELARACDTPRTSGICARTRGLLAGGERGLALLREAPDAHDVSPARLEQARSLLELGAALRRAGRRSDAIEPLRRAADLAHACGATALASQAGEELGVAGAAGRRYAFSGVDALTPSPHGGGRHEQPRDRGDAVRHDEDRGEPPGADVHEARHRLAHRAVGGARARRGRAGLRSAAPVGETGMTSRGAKAPRARRR